jgi:triacylglycerol lipase
MGCDLRAAALVLASALALAGCADTPSPLLLSIGSKIYPHKVDFREIYTFAEHADEAYFSKAEIKAKYPLTVRINSPDHTLVQYFLERDDAARTQFIAVRGTDNDTNWLQDFDVSERKDRQINLPVHTGFDRVTRAVYADVKPYLRPGYKTYVTGHSLGGAVAALLSIYLIEDGVAVERVVTFGQPKFTTTEGVKKLGFLPLTRVVDENDVVPMLPPMFIAVPTFGHYDHVGPEVIVLGGDYFVWLPFHDATRIALGQFWRSISFADAKDHYMHHYLTRIADKIKDATEVAYDERERFIFVSTNQGK